MILKLMIAKTEPHARNAKLVEYGITFHKTKPIDSYVWLCNSCNSSKQ